MIADKIVPAAYDSRRVVVRILEISSLMIGLWLFSLCVWFLLVSIGAHWSYIFPATRKGKIRFAMTWYSFVFPNTALVSIIKSSASMVPKLTTYRPQRPLPSGRA
jgi:hypothetical protein